MSEDSVVCLSEMKAYVFYTYVVFSNKNLIILSSCSLIVSKDLS